MPTKQEMIDQLTTLSQQMIIDRTTTDVNNLKAIGLIAYDAMTAAQKVMATTPQKGAYNPEDRNRVATYCNTFVALMRDYYSTITPDYVTMATNWGSIADPTQAQLTAYIDNIIRVRDKWYAEMHIGGTIPTITQIYDGISLSTANNIEKAILAIHTYLINYILSLDPTHCGTVYGTATSATAPITCGGFEIHMGVM